MEQRLKFFHFDSNIINSIAQLFQKTEESLIEDVDILKNWMKTQPHLPEVLDEKCIQNFLFLNKGSVEMAKKKIDMYYTFRSQVPDLVDNMNPTCQNLKELHKFVYSVPLLKPTKEGYRVFVSKCRKEETADKIEPFDVLRRAANLQEIRLKEDVMFGDVIIFDMDGASIEFLSKFTPVVVSRAITLYKEIYSIPLKGVYVVNSTSYINIILAIVKRILKPKIFERIHVCKDTSILREHFPLEMLPRDYGGTEKSLGEISELCEIKFQEYRDRFNLLDHLRVDENLRPSKLENDDFLGYYGSFKKLEVD